MCSTPRTSAKPRVSRRAGMSQTCLSSYSQMMRTASLQYEQRQEELARRRQLLLDKEKSKNDTYGI